MPEKNNDLGAKIAISQISFIIEFFDQELKFASVCTKYKIPVFIKLYKSIIFVVLVVCVIFTKKNLLSSTQKFIRFDDEFTSKNISGTSGSTRYVSGFSRRRTWINRQDWSHQWPLDGFHSGYRYDRNSQQHFMEEQRCDKIRQLIFKIQSFKSTLLLRKYV